MGSVVVAQRLSCPAACGILVSRPWMEPASSSLQSGFLSAGLPGKSLDGCHLAVTYFVHAWGQGWWRLRSEGRERENYFLLIRTLIPGGSDGKESSCNTGDLGLIPESGSSPGTSWQSTPVFFPGESHG